MLTYRCRHALGLNHNQQKGPGSEHGLLLTALLTTPMLTEQYSYFLIFTHISTRTKFQISNHLSFINACIKRGLCYKKPPAAALALTHLCMPRVSGVIFGNRARTRTNRRSCKPQSWCWTSSGQTATRFWMTCKGSTCSSVRRVRVLRIK